MANYDLRFAKSVEKDFRTIPAKDVRNIMNKIAALAENPRPDGCAKLAGSNCFRIRQGKYRIIYEIADETLIVLIVRIGHRKKVYKKL